VRRVKMWWGEAKSSVWWVVRMKEVRRMEMRWGGAK
jgi:hypothetical protein